MTVPASDPTPAPAAARVPYTNTSVYLSVDGLAAGGRLTDGGLPDISASRHENPRRIGLDVCTGPPHNVVTVSFNGSRADLAALLGRLRAALDTVPPHPADRAEGGGTA